MANITYERFAVKQGNGVPTIPPSPSHENGDWTEFDIYEGEMYLDLNTGIVYTRVGDAIRVVGKSGKPAIDFADGLSNPPSENASDVYVVINDAGLPLLDVDTIQWQSGTTVRYNFAEFSMLSGGAGAVIGDYFHATGALNPKHDGKFLITAVDVLVGYIEVTNPLVTDATDDEASDSPCTAYFTKAAWDGAEFNDIVEYDSIADLWSATTPTDGDFIINQADDYMYIFDGTNWISDLKSHIEDFNNPHQTTPDQLPFDDSTALNDPLLSTDVDAALKELRGRVYDRATKTYVDNLVAGLKWKQPVVVATTAAGTLATDFENGDTVDGVVLVTGDRILIKDQADATENGIYKVAASGAPTRDTDADTGTELVSASVLVMKGTINADKAFACTNDSITIGVDNITFTIFANIVQSASETNAGVIEIATAAEVNAGVDPVRAVVPARLADWWSAIKSAAATISGIWTFTTEKIRIKVDGANWYHAFKSVATSNQTWTLPDEGDQTFASRAYADAKVVDSVTDGETTTAPSRNAVYDLAAAMLGQYRIVMRGGVRILTGSLAGTYFGGHQQNSNGQSGVNTTLPPVMFNVRSADYPTVNGLEPKFRIRALITTNATAPTGTYRWALFPVTAGGGGTGGVTYTIGTEVASTTTATVTTPAGSTITEVVGSDFSLPADGMYCICCVKTGTIAALAEVHSQFELQHHNA